MRLIFQIVHLCINMIIYVYLLNVSVMGPETVTIPVLMVCDVHRLCAIESGEQITTTLPSNLTLMEVQYVLTRFVL